MKRRNRWIFLRSIGCDLVQGYVYARPMPAEELEAWMRARTAAKSRRSDPFQNKAPGTHVPGRF